MQQLQLTLDPKLDRPRLNTLCALVLDAMGRGEWMTLGEIREAVGRGSEAGISARLRELRRIHGYEYDKRRRGLSQGGLWEYRLNGGPDHG